LAPVLRNKKKLNQLNRKITVIEEKMSNTVFSQIFDNNLLVAHCGRLIKFTLIEKELWDEDRDDLKFEYANIDFD